MNEFFERIGYFSLTGNLQKKMDAAAEHLATGLNGRLERGGFWKGMPKVSISKNGIPVLITFYNGGSKVPLFFTRIRLLGITSGNFYLRIYNEGILPRIAKKFGMRDVEIGDRDFDKLFVVRSSDEAAAKRFLHSKTRHSIKKLYENQEHGIDGMVDVTTDSVKVRAGSKGMDSAMNVIRLLFTSSSPSFEMRLDEKGLCLEVFGLINQADKAQLLLDDLMTIYADCHLSRVVRSGRTK